jgi:hypothetical protein
VSEDGPEWFAPKRYGFGSGMPISWQGWVVTLGFIAIALATALLFAAKPIVMFAILVPATATLGSSLQKRRGADGAGGGATRTEPDSAELELSLLVDQAPFVEVGQHSAGALLG